MQVNVVDVYFVYFYMFILYCFIYFIKLSIQVSKCFLGTRYLILLCEGSTFRICFLITIFNIIVLVQV